MENVPQTFETYIDKITQKISYLDKYGGSVIVTVLTLFVFFLLFSYYYVMNRIKPIKADWVNQRCNPAVIPFAGLINTPADSNKIEFTATNFNHCTQEILSSIIGYFVQPVYYMTGLLMEMWGSLGESLNLARRLQAWVREQIGEKIANIFSRIFNILIPVQIIIIKLKDILAKSMGVLTTSLYTVLTGYLALKSFLGAFLEIIVLGLIIGVAIIIALWIIPFTWPAAAAGTAIFTAVAVPFTLIAISLGNIMHITSSQNIPNNPSCFDKNTIIKLKKGYNKICNINVGDILHDGSRVTATFKLSPIGEQMYKIDNFIVSGSHTIHHYKLNWIKVANHPNAIPVEHYNEPYIYCINTTNKRIQINNSLLLDWDDIDAGDFIILKCVMKHFITSCAPPKDIHARLEGGFSENTQIELKNGYSIKISKIKVGDILRFGERVLGIVEIDATNLNKINKYKINNKTFIGGPNLWVNDDILGKFSTLGVCSIESDNDVQKILLKNPHKLYQILTDTGSFSINNIQFMDYNSAIEQIMGHEWSKM